MPGVKYPFNDNTRVTTPFRQQNPGTTPPNGQSQFNVKDIGKPKGDYSVKPLSTFSFDLTNIFTYLSTTPQAAITKEGSVLWVTSLDQTANLFILFDDEPQANEFPIRNGFRISGKKFDKFRVRNATAQAGLTIFITVTRDFPEDRLDVIL